MHILLFIHLHGILVIQFKTKSCNNNLFENKIKYLQNFNWKCNTVPMWMVLLLSAVLFLVVIYVSYYLLQIFSQVFINIFILISANIEKHVKTKSPNASASTGKHWWCGEYTVR